jgi:hypothetical protein
MCLELLSIWIRMQQNDANDADPTRIRVHNLGTTSDLNTSETIFKKKFENVEPEITNSCRW